MNQRPIKFRAWDENRKRMVTQRLQFDYNEEYGPNNAYDENERQIEDMTLMQFTGLHDKNGKEIWEGDVLRNELGSLAEVKWDNVECGFQPIAGNPVGHTLEVIGNIYENPELLKP